jgi:hypothetical protein
MPKRGKDSDGKPWVWWPPNEIRYNADQVYFIFDYINTIRDGNWPVDPTSTGYNNVGWKASINTKPPFITPAEIAAEVDRRSRHCGLDWYLVNDYYEQGLKLKDIASQHFLDEDDVWNRIQRVIHYIASGRVPRWVTTEKRRGLEYKDWLDQGGWHRKRQENCKHRIRVSHA